jgi:hypothetical protein
MIHGGHKLGTIRILNVDHSIIHNQGMGGIWIDQWSKELDAFTVVDAMMHDEKNLFQIYD